MKPQNTKLFSLFFILSLSLSAYADKPKHLFVISADVVNSENIQRSERFVNMLSKNSGYPLKAHYVRSYDQMSAVLRDNPTALAWSCAAPYVEDAAKDGQQLLALPLLEGKPLYRSFIVSRKSDSGKTLLDFKSKVFTYSDPRSNSGQVAPAVVLKKAGYDIGTFFRLSLYTGSNEKCLDAIERGLADVSAIDEYVWINYTKENPHLKETLHVIEKLGPYPFTPLVAAKGVSHKDIKKIQDALVYITKEELAIFKKDFMLDGFVVKDKSFFDKVRKNVHFLDIDIKR